MNERLGSTHRSRSDYNAILRRRLHYFTTRFTSLPGTTITFTTILPSILATTLASASAAAFTTSSLLPTGTVTTLTSLPFICTGISTSSSRRRSAFATGHGTRNTTPSPPICSHNSAAKNGAKGASSNTKLRNTSATAAGETSPASIAVSEATTSLT